MTPAEFGLWEYARTVSHETRIFFLDCRKTATQFTGTTKSTIYRLALSLKKKGWFVPLRDSVRKTDGTYTANQYQPLSHEEWATNHPDMCTRPEPVPPVGQDRENQPVPPVGQDGTCPKIDDRLSQNRVSPVPPAGQSIVFKSCIERFVDIPASFRSGCTYTHRQKKNSKQKPRPIPKDFGISERVRAWANTNKHTDLELHLEYSVGWVQAQGRSCKDWDATFMQAIEEGWASKFIASEHTRARGGRQ